MPDVTFLNYVWPSDFSSNGKWHTRHITPSEVKAVMWCICPSPPQLLNVVLISGEFLRTIHMETRLMSRCYLRYTNTNTDIFSCWLRRGIENVGFPACYLQRLQISGHSYCVDGFIVQRQTSSGYVTREQIDLTSSYSFEWNQMLETVTVEAYNSLGSSAHNVNMMLERQPKRKCEGMDWLWNNCMERCLFFIFSPHLCVSTSNCLKYSELNMKIITGCSPKSQINTLFGH